MKKIVISLSFILAFVMFNNSAKALSYCSLSVHQKIHSVGCPCEDHDCSGYVWYSAWEDCNDDTLICADGYVCTNKWIWPDSHFYPEWVEYECLTPRFGCDVGTDCIEGNPEWYGYYSYWEPCHCLPE